MSYRLTDLRTRFRDYATMLGAPAEIVAFRESPSHDGSPHVEYEGSDLCYVVTERGCEFERRRTKDPDVLLYWLISDLAFQMASSYELRFRRANEDFRKLLFAKQIELLAAVKPQWGVRKEEELRLVLETHPYRDSTRG